MLSKYTFLATSAVCLALISRKRQRPQGDDDDALLMPQTKRSSTTLQCSEGSREAWESEVRRKAKALLWLIFSSPFMNVSRKNEHFFMTLLGNICPIAFSV